MGRDNRAVFYCSDAEKAEIDEWIDEKYGNSHSRSQALRKIVLATVREEGQIEDDATVHDKLDKLLAYHSEDEQHTHTTQSQSVHSSGKMSSTENVPSADTAPPESDEAEIGKRIAKIDETEPVTEKMVENIIIDVRGLEKGDPRTLAGWKDKIKRERVAFEHPKEQVDIWMSDIEGWVRSVESTVASGRVPAVASEYGLTTGEYDRLVEQYITQDNAQPVPDDGPSGGESQDGDATQDNTQSTHTNVDSEFEMLESASPAVADGGEDSSDSD